MKKILLSIKPEYVNKILSGEKKYEFRKRLSSSEIDAIVIHSTDPIQRVVGEVEVVDTLKMNPSILWEITKNSAGISFNKYSDYFINCDNACAYQLGRVIVYRPSMTLDEFGIKHAPQSFVYISDTPTRENSLAVI